MEGSLQVFKFLEELNLAHNNLSGLDRCLEVLSGCVFLRDLWLDHNPIAQEVRDAGGRIITRSYNQRPPTQNPPPHTPPHRSWTIAPRSSRACLRWWCWTA